MEDKLPDKRSSSPWSAYALIALGLILIFFWFASFANRSTRQSQAGLVDVYDADREVKVYLFEQYATAKGLQLTFDKRRTYSLSRALSVYCKPDLKYSTPAIRRCGVLMNELHQPGASKVFARLYSSEATKDLPKRDVQDLKDEAVMWQDIYSGNKLSHAKAVEYAAKIDKLNLGPVRVFAIEKLYTQAGMNDRAQEIVFKAKENAMVSMAGLGALMIGLVLAGIAGVALIIAFLSNRKNIVPEPEPVETVETESQTTAEIIPSNVLFGGFIAYIGISLFLGLVAGLTLKPALETLPADVRLVRMVLLSFGLNVAGGLAAIAVFYSQIRKLGLPISEMGLSMRDFRRNALWGLAGYCVVLPLVVLSSWVWNLIQKAWFPGVKTPPNPVVQWVMSGNDTVLLLVFLMVTVLAPVFEEIFFRGALYGALRERLGVTLAILVAAAAFAIVHPFPGGFLPIFAIGAVFSVLYETRKSLVPSMVAHALYNGTMFVAMYLLVMR
jgi:membrane protease YdiL (CAAX protease family)